jgi:hypothetical protein
VRLLDSAYRQTAGRLPENVALQIAEIAGTDRPDPDGDCAAPGQR